MITGGAFVAAVITRATNVVGVADLGRRPTGVQATALQWRDPQCCVAGCPADGYLETDHRAGWALTGQTSIDDLDRLCSHHHSLKTNHGYRLAPGTGKRPMRPPSPAVRRD
jgi:5-methylcytosine-specific restriction endonuclease McrA